VFVEGFQNVTQAIKFRLAFFATTICWKWPRSICFIGSWRVTVAVNRLLVRVEYSTPQGSHFTAWAVSGKALESLCHDA
jgi:hypothetical protein